MRQFEAGQHFNLGGIRFRVAVGGKSDDDLKLEVWTADAEWRPVEMRAVGMIHAFFCENEDHLYPPPRFLGADYWRAWLRLCERDWRAADKKLAKEKAWADRQRRNGKAAA